MLKVTDDGVNITLKSHAAPKPLLTQILVFAVIMAVIGGLKMLGIISAALMALLVLVGIVGLVFFAK